MSQPLLAFPQMRLCILNMCVGLAIGCFISLQAILHLFSPTLAVTSLLTLLLVFLGYRIKRGDLPAACQIIHYAVISIFTFYALAAYPAVSDAYQGELSALEWFWLNYGAYVALAAALASIYRPIFGVAPMLYVLFKKYTLSGLYGFLISGTDHMALIEVGLFLSSAIASFGLLARIKKSTAADLRLQDALIMLVLFAVAAHFANYFYSAYAKMALDANPFAWVLSNNTHYVMMAADLSGMMPLSMTETISALSHRFVEATSPLLNGTTLLVQLAALVGLWRIKWAIILTALYDVTHSVIFLVSGIFFWKWILLNFAIIAALGTLKHYKITKKQAVLLTAFTLMSPLIFSTAFLGWWDTASLNRVYFTAVTKDGQAYEVPSNYFLSGSVSVAQQKRVGLPYLGHYQLDAFGAMPHSTLQQMQLANQCELPLGKQSKMLEPVYRQLQRYVRRHHRFIVDNSAENGRFAYDWYPHHIWSMPWKFSDFRQLDKRRIDHYVFHIDSGCKTYQDGVVGFEPKLQGEYTITLPSL